ncbi:glycosyltransferase [Aurantiacibacter marinus]|uniref:Glycosyltransferase subfamily 4-like N-terminal domain-containing protein n=1 Tax=Aurantiacibacter marinus TaxID=874156 RepID=A0A0H0XQU7_9SPHN|nr:glycosyltransferase [Aurantiacibacter marinus]KLI64356.1 hypothetical protein AAV99_01660 [Aurantiacibacter marinus]
MTFMSCIHLNTDFAMGGVTKALSLFDHPDLREFARSRVIPIDPRRVTAPRLDAEIVINHATPNWASLPFYFMLRLRHRRSYLVHIEHTYTASWEAAHVPDTGRFRAMLKLMYANFDQIVAVSKAQREWLLSTGVVPAAKIRVIHPWSGTRGLDKVSPLEIDPTQPLKIGAIGRFDEAKGFDTLIRSMGLLPRSKFELTLAGAGPDEDLFRALARGVPNVRFAGKVDDVARFYEQCDLIVVPSRREAFGLVAAEARMAGRAVLVSDCDGLPEQVLGCGIVDDCSRPGSLARAIEEAARADLARMGRKAQLSMAGAETSRVSAWLALFVQARRALGECQPDLDTGETLLAADC